MTQGNLILPQEYHRNMSLIWSILPRKIQRLCSGVSVFITFSFVSSSFVSWHNHFLEKLFLVRLLKSRENCCNFVCLIFVAQEMIRGNSTLYVVFAAVCLVGFVTVLVSIEYLRHVAYWNQKSKYRVCHCLFTLLFTVYWQNYHQLYWQFCGKSAVFLCVLNRNLEITHWVPEGFKYFSFAERRDTFNWDAKNKIKKNFLRHDGFAVHLSRRKKPSVAQDMNTSEIFKHIIPNQWRLQCGNTGLNSTTRFADSFPLKGF